MINLKITLTSFILLLSIPVWSQESKDHLISFITDNPGNTPTSSFRLPMVGGPYDVDWNNDGIFDTTVVSGYFIHDYNSLKTHTIRIRGVSLRIDLNKINDKTKILDITQLEDKQY